MVLQKLQIETYLLYELQNWVGEAEIYQNLCVHLDLTWYRFSPGHREGHQREKSPEKNPHWNGKILSIKYSRLIIQLPLS